MLAISENHHLSNPYSQSYSIDWLHVSTYLNRVSPPINRGMRSGKLERHALIISMGEEEQEEQDPPPLIRQ